MKTEAKTILVLGGGIGGVVVASRLRKKLPREHRVVLIERETNYTFAPSFLWLMTGLRTLAGISRPLAKLDKLGIERIQGEIEQIDPAAKTVKVSGRELQGDYMVVALGAEMADETIPGLAEAGHTFYTKSGAEGLRDARLGFKKGRLVILVTRLPYKCPAAPSEASMLLEHDCRKRNIRDDVSIDIYTPEPGPMGLAGPENSKKIIQMLAAKGITYNSGHSVTKVDPVVKEIHFENGETVSYDFLVYVPPHRAPKVVRDSGLVGESGWVPVNKQTLETNIPGVFAIGDVTGIKLAVGKPLPKAGVFAHHQAETVANNLIHEITGKGSLKVFEGHGECFLEAGDGKAGIGSGNFYAEPKPQINLKQPSHILHLGKVAFEKYFLFKWF